jgi:hypothetical protein
MRLKDLVVGREYVIGDKYTRYYREYVPVTVLSVDFHRWPFGVITTYSDRDDEEATVDIEVNGVTYKVPEKLTVLRSGATRGALITWAHEGRGDVRMFHVVPPGSLLMTAHDFELVMASEIAEEEKRADEEKKRLAALRLEREREVAEFNAVFGKRLAGRPDTLTPHVLKSYVESDHSYTRAREAMQVALWAAGPPKKPTTTRKKQP